MKKIKRYSPLALVAAGVFLGRGAQADTILDFDADAAACTPPQLENPNAPPGITNFGNYAAASSGGVTVSGGFGTPNIGLIWGGIPSPDTRWEYYNDAGFRWSGVQLQDAAVGNTEKLTFVPNNPGAAVVIKSFNFHPYYFFTGSNGGDSESSERFTFDVSVVSGTNLLAGPIHTTFRTDATKNHPVSINYTGAPGQTLKLRITRAADVLSAGETVGDAFDIAVDDITFAQTPTSILPAGPQVVSVSPADDATGVPANAAPAYTAIVADGARTFSGPVQLMLDGTSVSPAPTVTSLGGGQTSVTYPGAAGMLSSGNHSYSLIYTDNLGGFYTNEVVFTTAYTTLPSAYALPPGSGVVRGFTFRTASANSQVLTAPTNGNSIARAEAQLAGTLINPDTSTPYINESVPGTNSDGSYNIDTVLNYDNEGVDAGNIGGDQQFPGMFGFENWFATEAMLYLDLPAGYYRLGVNSDDGFQVTALPPAGTAGAPMVVGVYDGARGVADTLFDVLVQTSGVYPFRLVYFDGTGSASCEFFSVNNLTSNTNKVLINDSTGVTPIKSYRVLLPHISNIARNGANVDVQWAYGTPPFQVQFKTDLTNSWSNLGAPTTNRTVSIPIQPGSGFIRIGGKP